MLKAVPQLSTLDDIPVDVATSPIHYGPEQLMPERQECGEQMIIIIICITS